MPTPDDERTPSAANDDDSTIDPELAAQLNRPPAGLRQAAEQDAGGSPADDVPAARERQTGMDADLVEETARRPPDRR